MISAVAFCPHPPLLIPEIAQGATSELDELRAACRATLKQVAADAARIVALGAGPHWRRHLPTARGTLAPYGVPVEVPLGSDAPGPVELPLSLTVGAWLLRDALGPDSGASGWSIGPQAGRLSVEDEDAAVALVVMGDGSARRSTSAPGYLDERAAPFDAAVATALAAGDPHGLRVDSDLGAQLLAAGPPVWNALAPLLEPAGWDAELLYDEAPYGVGYFVACWTRRG